MISPAALRALLQAATDNYAWHVESGEFRDTIVRFAPPDGGGEAAGWRWFQTGTPEQAALIVALVNAAPSLLDEVERLLAIRDGAVAFLAQMDYACHRCGQVRCGCEYGPFPKSPTATDAVKLAREWLARNRGPDDYATWDLARAVVEQADYIRDLLDHRAVHIREINALRAALGEALCLLSPYADPLDAPTTTARIAELRRLLL